MKRTEVTEEELARAERFVASAPNVNWSTVVRLFRLSEATRATVLRRAER